MKLVATSDWHLDQSTAGVDRYDDTCQAIDVSVDAAIEMKANAYLMCGDLTDPNNVRSHRSVTKAIAVQRRLRENKVQPIFVAGNHDVIEDGSGKTTLSPLAATGFGSVYEQPTMQILECGVVFIALPFTALSHSYDPDEFIRKCAKAIGDDPRPVFIAGHLNLGGINPGSETTEMPRGRDVFWPMEAIRDCFPSNAAVVGGHYHTPQVYDGVTIIGSTVRLRFDERDNELGYLVMEV